MRFLLSIFFASQLFGSLAMATQSVPLEHRGHCREWKNGACVDGALTDLAKSLGTNERFHAQAEGSRCEKVCVEACPQCSKCSLCGFCDFYESESCIGVAYFADEETCREERTNSCCDLCDAHCSDKGACGEGEYCNGGDRTTSVVARCIEQTTGEVCTKCERPRS